MGATLSRGSAVREREDGSAGLERAAKRQRSAAAGSNNDMMCTASDRGGALVIAGEAADPPNLSTLPEDISMNIFRYLAGKSEGRHPRVGEPNDLQALLALGQTCRSLHTLLQKDEVWGELFPTVDSFEHHASIRERVFISRALKNTRKWQKS